MLNTTQSSEKQLPIHAVLDWLEYRRSPQNTIRLHSRLNIYNIFFTDMARLNRSEEVWGDHLEVFRRVYYDGLDSLDNYLGRP